MRYIFSLAYKNISRNRRRSLLSFSAIALTVMVVAIMESYTRGIVNDMKKNIFLFETAT